MKNKRSDAERKASLIEVDPLLFRHVQKMLATV